MKYAISYSRFSSAKQGKGSSIARQHAMFQDWLRQHPEYEASTIRAEDRGVSAYSGKHRTAGLGSILEAIKDGKIQSGDAVCIEAIDRLTRQPFNEAYDTFRAIVNSDVLIYTLEDGQCYDRNSSQGSQMYLLVAKIQAAHEYSRKLSDRLKGAYKNKKEKAQRGEVIKAPNRPYWIGLNNKIIQEEAALVERIIDLYKSGAGQVAIVKQLNAEYPNRPNVPKDMRSIKRLLQSESLIGRWRGVECFESVISLTEFLGLQDLVTKRTIPMQGKESYLLSGLIRCKVCGSNFNFRRKKPKSAESEMAGLYIVYANCSRFLKGSGCDSSITIPYEVAEVVFNRNVADVLYSIAAGIAVDSLRKDEYANLQSEYQLAKTNKERAINVYRITGEGLDEVERYQLAMNFLQEQIDAHISKESAVAEREYSLLDFEDGTPDQKAYAQTIQRIIRDLESNPVQLRNELKAYGFCLSVSRSPLGIGVLEIAGNRYVLKKRSQKMACYLVEAEETAEDGGELVRSLLEARRGSYRAIKS